MASLITSRLDLTPSRSDGDRKEYRLITLQNGLECLLISTFSEQTASAMAARRPSSVMTEEQEERLRKASIPDKRFLTNIEQVRSVRTFSEEKLKRVSDASADSHLKPRTESKEQMDLAIHEEEDDDDAHSEEDDEVGDSPRLNNPKSPSRMSVRDSSSKASGINSSSAAQPRPQSRQPSIAGVVSGEAGRKLSLIFPSPVGSPMAIATNPIIQQDSSVPNTPTSQTGPQIASRVSRASIIEMPRERPPGLRLSRLLGGSSQSDFPITSPHSHGIGDGGLASPIGGSATVTESVLGNNMRTHRTSMRSNSLVSSRAMSFVYPLAPPATDASSDTCAVAMAVAVGSFATPEHLDGLAHFLEHMLFMGSEKFPRENEFDLVLSRAGGSSNAYTDTERTVYHFAVPQMHLKECLKVFTQFFVSPLLLPEASMRELNSIESEFALRQNIDGCRLQEIWRETSRPDTPYSKFTCGNMQTLKTGPESMGVDVNAALRGFYDKYYVSGNMKLVVISADPLADLEASIVESLKDVRGGPPTNESLSLTQHGFPWRRYNPFGTRPTSSLHNPVEPGVAAGCCFRVPPTHDMHEMQMTWQLPPQFSLYKSKPTEYVAHALGHESAGSILAELKTRGWATALMAGVSPEDGFTNNSGVTLFNVTISLTSAGLSQWIFVAGLVFEFVGILKRTGPVKWIYEELKEVAAMQYRFHEEPDPRWMAQRLCVHMLPQTGFDKEHLLTGASLVFDWNPDAINAVLERLEPESVRIDLISSRLHDPPPAASPSVAGAAADDLLSLTLCQRPHRPPVLEKHTGAQYWVDAIPQAVVYSWRAVLTGKSTVGYAGERGEETFPRTLGLPPRNPFISSDFRIKPIRKHETENHYLIGAELRIKGGLSKSEWSVAFKTAEGAPSSFSSSPSSRRSKRTSTSLTASTPVLPSSRKSSTNTTAKHLSFVKSRKSVAAWDVGIVVAVDTENEAILVRYTAKEGVRKWHKLDFPALLLEQPATPPKALALDRGRTVARVVSVKSANGETDQLIPQATARAKRSDPTREDYDDVADLFSANQHSWLSAFPRVPAYESLPQPTLAIGSDDFFSLWFLPDTRYRSPRVSAYVSLLTPLVAESALNAALADLFAVLVFESLNQESYMAFIVDLDFEIQVTPGLGIQLHFSGFSHKLPELIRIVLRRTFFFTQWVSPQGQPQSPAAPSTNPRESFFKRKSTAATANNAEGQPQGQQADEENEFEAFFMAPDPDAPREFDTPIFYARLEALLIDYVNAGSRFRSGAQISSVMFDMLCLGTWTPDEKALAARAITPAVLIDFANKIFSTCRVEGLIQGNLDEGDVQKFYRCVETALRVRQSKPPAKPNLEPRLRCQVLPVVSEKNQPVSGWIHILEAVESPSHSVELFFQIGQDNPEDRVLASAIEQLMREPLYADLRTKQQLGYSVKCGVRSVCGTVGFVIEITSDVHGPEVLAADIDDFLHKMRSRIEDMPQEEFILNMCGLANQFLEKTKNLAEDSARHWNSILSHAFYGMPYVWNSAMLDASLVKSVCSKTRVLEAFTNWLDPVQGKRRRASVFVVGYGYEVEPLVKALKRPCVKLLAHPHGAVGTKLSTSPGEHGARNGVMGGRKSSLRCSLM